MGCCQSNWQSVIFKAIIEEDNETMAKIAILISTPLSLETIRIKMWFVRFLTPSSELKLIEAYNSSVGTSVHIAL